MPALEAGGSQLILTGHPIPFGAGNRRSPVGRAAGDLIDPHLALKTVGKAHHNHPLVEQRIVETEDGRLLPAVLGIRARKYASHFADERPFGPELARGIQELAHLTAHVAKAGRWPEYYSISLLQFHHLTNGTVGNNLLRFHSYLLLENLGW